VRQTQVDTATHCNTLQHLAARACCNTLQHARDRVRQTQVHTATHCNTLQHTATHCNTPQHPATHCNTLHHARDRVRQTQVDPLIRCFGVHTTFGYSTHSPRAEEIEHKIITTAKISIKFSLSPRNF